MPPREQPPAPRLYTPEEAARVLSISRTQVYDLVKSGVLPAVLPPGITRGMRIRAEDLDAYVRAASRVPWDDGRPARSRSRRREAAA